MLIDHNLTQITPFLYVSAEETVRQFQPVFSNGIDCVINVAYELPQIVFPLQSGIVSIKYPIEDAPYFPAVHYFDAIADRIAANVASNRRTLIYCHQGRSRSITFILAYLIKYHHLPLSTAFTLVRDQRQLASPNIGFWTQLKLYELYQHQNNSSNIFNNLQYSGRHILHKISDGIKQVIFTDPFINILTNRANQRPSIRFSYPYRRIYF